MTMLLGQFCFSVNDSLVKWTVLKMPGNDNLFMVVFFRGALMCLMISTILAFQGKFRFGRIIKLSVLHGRGLIEVGLTFSFLTSILMLPLTDVYTILLTRPNSFFEENDSRCSDHQWGGEYDRVDVRERKHQN